MKRNIYPNTPLKSTCAYIEFDKFKVKIDNEGLNSFGLKFVYTRKIHSIEEIICFIHRVGALISDIGTCAFIKRGIRVGFKTTPEILVNSLN